MKKKIILIVFFLVFLLLGLLAVTNKLVLIDNYIYNLIISIKSDNLTSFFKFISFLSSTKFLVTVIFLLIIYILIKQKDKLLLIPINSILSVVFNNIFKLMFRRERPVLISLIKEKGYSYPSGHAMISILFYGTIIYLIRKSNIKYKNILTVLISLFIILIGISRIYLGVHFFSDIIGGYLLSILIMLIEEIVIERLNK